MIPEKNAIPKEAIALIRSMYIIAFFLLPFLNREVINSKDIKHILGYEGRDELIHKDDLVKMNL